MIVHADEFEDVTLGMGAKTFCGEIIAKDEQGNWNSVVLLTLKDLGMYEDGSFRKDTNEQTCLGCLATFPLRRLALTEL